ncbi:hypothetical protein ACFS6H_11835 [Terrimonas rubra]|uniref:Uncharacterized protein n=1 Tax=Terrimonas rubra TaxID=1035890 RepID=A0ABW6A563_9BACT
MEIISFNKGNFSVWTESAVVEFDEEELENSFMNIKLFVNSNESIGMNVWTVNYLNNKLSSFVLSENKVLVPPDIIVKSLHYENIKNAILEYLNEGDYI